MRSAGNYSAQSRISQAECGGKFPQPPQPAARQVNRFVVVNSDCHFFVFYTESGPKFSPDLREARRLSVLTANTVVNLLLCENYNARIAEVIEEK